MRKRVISMSEWEVPVNEPCIFPTKQNGLERSFIEGICFECSRLYLLCKQDQSFHADHLDSCSALIFLQCTVEGYWIPRELIAP